MYTTKVFPFGYKSWTEPDPVEAAAIQRAAADLLAGTATAGQIAARWNLRGPRRPQKPGLPWDVSEVSRVLRQRRLAGVVVKNGVVQEEPAPWVPILSRSTWDALQVVMPRFTGVRHDIAHNRSALASRLAVCGVCGSLLEFNASIRRKPARQRYVCSTVMRGRNTDGLQHVQIARTILDGRIRVAVVGLVVKHRPLLDYQPRDLSTLSHLLGAAASAGDDIEVAVLAAERDDRLLAEALAPLDDDDEQVVAEQWDELPLKHQIKIVERTLRIEVSPGRGSERVLVQDLLA